MLVLHVYIMGRQGNIERSYDFLRNDGKEELEGCDLVIPYDDSLKYPLSEAEAASYTMTMTNEFKGDH